MKQGQSATSAGFTTDTVPNLPQVLEPSKVVVKRGGPDKDAVPAFSLKESGMVLETEEHSGLLPACDLDEALEGLLCEQRAGGDGESTKVPTLATSTKVQNTDKVGDEEIVSCIQYAQLGGGDSDLHKYRHLRTFY